MQIAYSAYRLTHNHADLKPNANLEGYLAACHKHADTIAAIRRYVPGWRPKPPDGLQKGQLQIA